MSRKVDILVTNNFTTFSFRPMTGAAQDWLADNVQSEPWQWLGGTLVVDHRFARDLAAGAQAAGLVVG